MFQSSCEKEVSKLYGSIGLNLSANIPPPPLTDRNPFINFVKFLKTYLSLTLSLLALKYTAFHLFLNDHYY